jgi:hypothetical protein
MHIIAMNMFDSVASSLSSVSSALSCAIGFYGEARSALSLPIPFMVLLVD